MSTPSSFVRMFKPRFAALVESGAKSQTVRPMPKRMPKVGDRLSLRCWRGLPYRSKQRVLREATIVGVERVSIYASHMWHETCDGLLPDGLTVTHRGSLDDFAKADGFADYAEMLAWFEAEHSLPFQGVAIYWST